MSCNDVIENREKLFLWFTCMFGSHQDYLDDGISYFISKKIDDLEKFCRDGSAIAIGAYEQRVLCAFLWGYKYCFNGHDRIHITKLYVDETFRKKGIATSLIEFVEVLAMDQGVSEIDLNVNVRNSHAFELYKKSGFLEESVHMVKSVNLGS